MHSLGKIVFIVLAMLAVRGEVWAQAPDSCLKFLGPDRIDYIQQWRNPDSIMVDSCFSSPTYLHKFAKQWFSLDFEYGSILPIPAGPVDTIIQVEWTRIDTNYRATRARFDTLEQRFGHFILQKGVPNIGDTADFLSAIFDMKFDSPADIQAVNTELKIIPLLVIWSARYHDQSGYFFGSVLQLPHDNNSYQISPNPAFNFLHISGERLKNVNRFTIFSDDGKVLISSLLSKDSPIDVHSLSSGKYFLIFNANFGGTFIISR